MLLCVRLDNSLWPISCRVDQFGELRVTKAARRCDKPRGDFAKPAKIGSLFVGIIAGPTALQRKLADLVGQF
jgi:hypothetical protein